MHTHTCPPQEGVRVHTIHRETGVARVWQLPMAFFTHYDGNAYDTEGACQCSLC